MTDLIVKTLGIILLTRISPLENSINGLFCTEYPSSSQYLKILFVTTGILLISRTLIYRDYNRSGKKQTLQSMKSDFIKMVYCGVKEESVISRNSIILGISGIVVVIGKVICGIKN